MHTHVIHYFATLMSALLAKLCTNTRTYATITGPPIGVELGHAVRSPTDVGISKVFLFRHFLADIIYHTGYISVTIYFTNKTIRFTVVVTRLMARSMST